MQEEAMPLINKFELKEDEFSVFPKGLPWVRYHGPYKDLHMNILWPGKDLTLGTVSASLIAYASIQALKPDLIINAGTAGGSKAKGASVGDIFLISNVAFHDRRIPLLVFDLYGVGLRHALSTPNLLEELNLEGAAVGYVSDLLNVPVDGEKPTAEEFRQNLAAVTAALDTAFTQVIDFSNGKCLSEL